MSGIISLPNGIAGSRPIKSAMLPQEGPKTVPFVVPFFSGGLTEYTIDLTLTQQLGYITSVQTCYIDNTDNAEQLIVEVPSVGQRFIMPAGFQGYFPVLAPIEPVFKFSTDGNIDVFVQLINVPMPAQIWGASGGSVIPNPLNVNILSQSGALDVVVTAPDPLPVEITSGGSTPTYFNAGGNATFAATDATGSSRLAFYLAVTAGMTVLFQNQDTTNNAFIAVGGVAVTVTAGGGSSATNDGGLCVPPGGTVSFQLRATDTYFVAVCATGQTALLRVTQFEAS